MRCIKKREREKKEVAFLGKVRHRFICELTFTHTHRHTIFSFRQPLSRQLSYLFVLLFFFFFFFERERESLNVRETNVTSFFFPRLSMHKLIAANLRLCFFSSAVVYMCMHLFSRFLFVFFFSPVFPIIFGFFRLFTYHNH